MGLDRFKALDGTLRISKSYPEVGNFYLKKISIRKIDVPSFILNHIL